MSYYHDTLTSPTDALQKIVVWLQSLGWAVNMSQASGNGWRAHLSKNNLYVNLRAFHNETAGSGFWYGSGWGIFVNLSTGFDSSKDWSVQPGSPRTWHDANLGMRPCVKLGSAGSVCGPLNGLYCFSDENDNIIIVIEGYPGITSYLGWGNVIKVGTWTGGAYFFASNSSTLGVTAPYTAGYTTIAPAPFYNGQEHAALVRIDVDNTLNQWIGVGEGSYITTNTTDADCTTLDARIYTPLNFKSLNTLLNVPPTGIPCYGGYGNSDSSTSEFQNRLFNAGNFQHLLAPIHLYVTRAEGGYSLIGRVPKIYACTATEHGMSLGAELVRGADHYIVFPKFAVKKVA